MNVDAMTCAQCGSTEPPFRPALFRNTRTGKTQMHNVCVSCLRQVAASGQEPRP